MNDEHVQTVPDNVPEQRKWFTVDEAFLTSQEAGLDRTKKTIRSWCRQDHIESQKQTTPTGERWMIEATSLSVKIRNELEFQREVLPVHESSNPSEHVQPSRTQVRTSAHSSEPMQTGTNQPKQTNESASERLRIDDLETEVRSLEIDKAVRDKHVDFLIKQNAEGQRNLLSQSRYIGHLETQVMQLGGAPDQRFLKAPIAEQREEPMEQSFHPDTSMQHPEQQQFDIHT